MTASLSTNEPNHLTRFTDLLRDAGYTQRTANPELGYVSPRLKEKEYLIIETSHVDTNLPHNLESHYRVVLGEDRGYLGFYCDFYFDSNGNLVGHGAWE